MKLPAIVGLLTLGWRQLVREQGVTWQSISSKEINSGGSWKRWDLSDGTHGHAVFLRDCKCEDGAPWIKLGRELGSRTGRDS